MTPPAQPVIGDAVVSDGTKYRIRALTLHAALLALAGPSWRHGSIVMLADRGRLTWDKVAAVWRGPTVAATPVMSD